MRQSLENGPIATGGSVLALCAGADGTLWLLTEAGLWRGGPGEWTPLPEPSPLAAVSALLAVETGAAGAPLLLVGGPLGALAYSLDGGQGWSLAYGDAVEQAISCFAASPRFAEDRTLLAGTDGAGVLRSVDGGRSWRLANAGLEEFEVAALAAAPGWGERELAFAATSGGLYRSPNGGRYWKRVADFAGAQALAVSPAFETDGLVLAAGEGGLGRSIDGGRHWTMADPAAAPNGVNCLLFHPDQPLLVLAGTADGAIYRSEDGGANWVAAGAGYGPVLALGAAVGALYAGLYDDGLLRSEDGGRRWAGVPGLAARDLTRLARGPDGALLAFGASGGAWRWRDGWERLALEPGAPLTALLPLDGGRALLGTTDGALLLGDGVEAAGIDGAVTALARRGDELWLGAESGDLWRSADGRRWEPARRFEGAVVALAAEDERGALWVAALAEAGGVTLWRQVADGGWERWLEAADGAPVALCPPEWAAFGGRLRRWDGRGWQPAALDGAVVALAAPFAATRHAIYRNEQGWRRLDISLPPGGVRDLAVLDDGRLVCLGPGGVIRIVG